MSAALKSPEILNALHVQMSALGWSLLQPYRFGQNDQEHIRTLLDMADFPRGAKVLDVGCGVGECARLMQIERPDLEFVLLNFSEAQLNDCPVLMEKRQADAHDLPFVTESFDAVMFNAALGNMDCMVALAEASRVLKPGGVLFLNELNRLTGNNAEMERILSFRAYDEESIFAFAQAMGLTYAPAGSADTCSEYLRTQMNDDDSYDRAFAGVEPGIWRFVKGEYTPLAARHGALFARHERVALQVSGGKDSLAMLHAMTPWLDHLCVYWVNPGDPTTQTLDLMFNIRKSVPHFKEVAGRQKEVIAQDGWPFDTVAQAHTSDGNFVFGETPFKMQTRLSCCFRSLMLPMHEAMIADGVTCILRGKRSEEADKSPSRSGETHSGMELCYPLWDWSESEVLAYLTDNGIELPESYQWAGHSLDCLSCTAWSGEGLSRFLKAKYPERYKEYVRRVRLMKVAVTQELLNCEV